ncbi:hypothetical protein GOP47_0029387 [Adiantum capillus-veneris]|nr:hypothetical protein GOP47_0029387 [Adiantum capillus-veneris]
MPSCRSVDAWASSTTEEAEGANLHCRVLQILRRQGLLDQTQKKRQKMPSCKGSSVINVCSRRRSEGRASSSRTAQKTSDQACSLARTKEQDEGWSSLMEDWQWRVMALLPLRRVLQFQAVCKAWNTVLSSPEFGKFWFPKYSGSWLVMARRPPPESLPWEHELIAFDTSLSAWLSLSSLIGSKCSQSTLADLGGMFCSQVANGSRPLEEPQMEYYECIHDSAASYLMVLNPVTGSSMRLLPNPKMETWNSTIPAAGPGLVKRDDWCLVRVPPLPLFHRCLSSWLCDMGVAAASKVQLLAAGDWVEVARTPPHLQCLEVYAISVIDQRPTIILLSTTSKLALGITCPLTKISVGQSKILSVSKREEINNEEVARIASCVKKGRKCSCVQKIESVWMFTAEKREDSGEEAGSFKGKASSTLAAQTQKKRQKMPSCRASSVIKIGEEGARRGMEFPHGPDWQWCVMALLPLRNVLQFRAVCKAWNTVPEFGRFWFPKHSGSWLVMARRPLPESSPWEQELIAFDTSSSAWLSFSSLLGSKCSQNTLADLGGMFCSQVANGPRNHECHCLVGLRVRSNASGIMCFLCSPLKEPETEYYECIHDSTAYYLMVLNPVTGLSMRLPPNPKCAARLKSWFPFPFHISLQSLPANHYRLFRHEQWNGNLEFYDSSSRSWTVGRAAVCDDQRGVRFATAVDLKQADQMVFFEFVQVVFRCTRRPQIFGLQYRILLAAILSTDNSRFVSTDDIYLAGSAAAAASAEVQLLGYFFCTCWGLDRSAKNTSWSVGLGGYQWDRRTFRFEPHRDWLLVSLAPLQR